MAQKKEGAQPHLGKIDNFHGDRSVVITKKQLDSLKKNPIFGDLYLSDIGFYPNAKDHFRNRDNGTPEHILIYCIDGSGYIKINGQAYQLSPNTFFVIEGWQQHTYWASEPDPWSIYWLHFGGERSILFQKHFNKVNDIKPSGNSRTDDRIRLFNEILTVLESGLTKENIEYTNLWLSSLLTTFFYIETFCNAKGFRDSDPVEHSILFMQNNINKLLKMDDIAKRVNLSASHLSKLFRNKTGTSPMDYFINLKMQEGIRLMTNRSMRIKEVAFNLGYNDPFYFTRIFTKHIGVNPTSFLRTSKRTTKYQQLP